MADRRTADYRTLASLSRINLLNYLQKHGSQTVAELVEATGLHHNTAREHLHRLIDAGFVESEPVPTNTKGRPKISYRAALGAASPARQARLLASEERTELVRQLLAIEDITVARTPETRQLEALDDHLDQCGFEAEVSGDSVLITVHDCPFTELAKCHPQVCEVHFALLKDALDVTDGPIRARAVHPFSSPHTCTIDMDNTPTAEY